MGTIRNQSVLGTIYTYLGAIVGFLTTGILTPKILSPEQIGILSLVIAYATVFATIANLGMPSVITRFFPYFRNTNNYNNGFLFVSIVVPFLGFVFSLIVFLFIKPLLIKNAVENYELMRKYMVYVIPFIFSLLYFTIFDSYYKMLYNVTLGSFFKELVQRFIILISLVLYSYSIIQFEGFVFFYLIAFIVPFIALIFAIAAKNEFSLKPNLSFIDKKLKNKMIDVGLFSILGAFAGVVTINIDRIMVERLMGLSNTGIYTIAFFFGSLVVLPSRPLMKISSAYIAEAWKKNDLQLLHSILYKSTITQFIVGLLLLIGIWANIDNIMIILPKEYEEGMYVILFIGLAYLSDMFIGVSQSIIANSSYYRYQTYIMLLQIVLIIITNFIFIPIYGIVGAALASFIAKLLINILRMVIIKYKISISALSLHHFYILLIALGTYFLNTFLPVLDNYIFDIFYRSIIITILFCAPIYFLRLSEDINDFVNALWKRFIH